MRYHFVGRKIPDVGKTLWEIVGNLKNFGVGRLVRMHEYDSYPELSFFKIIKVQPLPPERKEFEERKVLVYIEEIFRGCKREIRPISSLTSIAGFQLIPKVDEEKYLKAAETVKPLTVHIHKYCSWPPLYKKLWEKESQDSKDFKHIPKLEAQNDDYKEYNVVVKEEELPPLRSSLYKGDLTVHEMYLEIVRLKKLINAHTSSEK